MKKVFIIAMLAAGVLAACTQKEQTKTEENMQKLVLTQEWDKMFPKSDKVDHKKVTFHNRYGIEIAADMYTPKNAEGKLPAIAVTGPFGAVKAHSRYFSEYAFEKMTGKKAFESSIAECATANEIPTGKYAGSYKEGNKELFIIAGASHIDLYDDQAGVIPYDKMEQFFLENLK